MSENKVIVMLDNCDQKKITLKSCDGKKFGVNYMVVKMSRTLKDAVDFISTNFDEPIPVPNVKGRALEKVLKWCCHHKNDPTAQDGLEYKSPNEKELSQWDIDFFKVSKHLYSIQRFGYPISIPKIAVQVFWPIIFQCGRDFHDDLVSGNSR